MISSSYENADWPCTLPSTHRLCFEMIWERVEEAEIVDGTEIALGNAKLVFRV